MSFDFDQDHYDFNDDLSVPDATVHVPTKQCVVCGRTGAVTMTASSYERMAKHGQFIQDAAPELTPDEREQVITGTHPKCWDELMGPAE